MIGIAFQTFEPHDLIIVALLVVLEGVLSIDNALVLGILANRLPKHLQKKALTYGLLGAFAFRFIAIGTATFLLHWTIIKLVGGLYLVWIAFKHFVLDPSDTSIESKAAAAGMVEEESVSVEQREHATAVLQHAIPVQARPTASFWATVLVIELTDIAFAVDSILAAIGVIPASEQQPNPKIWIVLVGGFLGVIMMRFAAILFIRLLEKFPRFETAAYVLVTIIGLKLLIDWASQQFHFQEEVNFHHSDSPAFWVFWITMILGFCVGFLPQKNRGQG